jgi:acetyl esterase/lipase
MLWYRQNYVPNEADWAKWDSSPLLAPDEAFKRSPPTWIGVAELDILRDEGLAYAEKLKSFGVPAEVKIYKGAPHPIMAMDGEYNNFSSVDQAQLFSLIAGVLEVGKELVTDAAQALAKGLGTA